MKMIPTLFRHAWLKFVRSKALGHKLLETVLIAFVGLNVAVSLSVAGLVGGSLIAEAYPEGNVLAIGLGFLVFYFVTELLVRYFFQKFPVPGVRPYLVLPVPRKAIANTMLLRSFLSVWSVMPWFLAVPMYFSLVSEAGSTTVTAGYFIFVAGATLLSNYLAFAMVAVRTQKITAFAILAAAVLILWLEFTGRAGLAGPIGAAVLSVLQTPVLWPAFLLMPFLVFLYLRDHLAKSLGEESIREFDRKFRFNAGFGIFGKYGTVGQLVDLEVRLILRSKRARQYFVTSIIFLALPLVHLSDLSDAAFPVLLLVAFLLTGIATLNHGQLALSWNSLHFDFLLTRARSIEQVFLAKYYVLALFCVLTYLISLPYCFFVPGLFFASTVMLLINATVSAMVYLWLAAVSSLRVDPDEGSAFSMSGFGVMHYVIIIPIVAVPILLFVAGKLISGDALGAAFIAGFGIALLLLHKKIMALIASVFAGNRYRLGAVMRDK
ncbi:MAG: DUF5687 family protein [Cryomorphaceae bacterium]